MKSKLKNSSIKFLQVLQDIAFLHSLQLHFNYLLRILELMVGLLDMQYGKKEKHCIRKQENRIEIVFEKKLDHSSTLLSFVVCTVFSFNRSLHGTITAFFHLVERSNWANLVQYVSNAYIFFGIKKKLLITTW